MFEYLMLMLVRHAGVRNPFAANGVLYFKTENKSYKLHTKEDGWHLIDYTHQHNAPDLFNREYTIDKSDWREVLRIVILESPE